MATRMASRYISRRLSSSGKVLGEEEKAAENVYIMKIEQEKLQKLAQKGPKGEEKSGAETVAGSIAKAVGGDAESSSKPGASTDTLKNYGVVAGLVTALGAAGWYFFSKDKKPEEVRD